MEIINPWLLYFVLQLDSIRDGALLFGFLSGGVIAVAMVFLAIHSSEDPNWRSEHYEDRRLFRRKIVRWTGLVCVPALLLSIAVNFLLPSTKNMAAIIVVPAIVNNESVQKEAGELYTLAKQALTDAIGTPTTTQKPAEE